MVSASPTTRHVVTFSQWFPALRDELTAFVATKCSAEVKSYTEAPTPDQLGPLASKVVSCLLEQFPEADKFNFAVSAVLLGLLPTALGLVGSNPAETGLLAYRRPLLASLLSLSSPVFAPIRAHEYFHPAKHLYTHSEEAPSLKFPPSLTTVVLVLQYVLALGCLANTVAIVRDLSVQTVCVWAPEIWYLPIIWTMLGIVILALGAITVWARVELKEDYKEMKLWQGLWKSLASPFRRGKPKPEVKQTVLSTEWTLSWQQTKVNATVRPTTNHFLFLAWLTSACTVFHMIFGTVLFSGALFIAPVDAVQVAGRFFVSTIVCRGVVMYELQGVRGTWSTKEQSRRRNGAGSSSNSNP